MPFNTLRGSLRRPYRGIGKSAFDVTLSLSDFDVALEQSIERSVNAIFARGYSGGGGGGGYARGYAAGVATGVATAPQLPRGTILDQFGNPLTQPETAGGPTPRSRGGRGGGNTRFSAYSPGASFYGGAGAGFGSLALGGTRLGIGGGLALGGGLFAVGALKELSQELITASSSFESFERTVRATEQTSEDAAIRWQRLLEIANETVGIDIQGIVRWNSQLRVVGVEADRVDAIIRGVTKTVSELGGGVHVTVEALAQLTDGIVRNHLTVRDWRAIVGRIAPILGAMSTALGYNIRSLDDFREAVKANNITIGEGLIRSLEQLDRTAVGLQGTYIAATDRVNEASFKLKATLGEGFKDSLTPILFGYADALNAINDALEKNPVERIQQRIASLTTQRDAAPAGSIDRQAAENAIRAERANLAIERQQAVDAAREQLRSLRTTRLNPLRSRIETTRQELAQGFFEQELADGTTEQYPLTDAQIRTWTQNLQIRETTLTRLVARERGLQQTLRELGVGTGATSVGALRTLEADARASQRPQREQPTPVSLGYFAELTQSTAYQEEVIRQQLQSRGGDFALQLSDIEKQITTKISEIQNAVPEQTEQQTASQQQIVQGLQTELDLLYTKLRVLKELAQEQKRETDETLRSQTAFRRASETANLSIYQQRVTTEGFDPQQLSDLRNQIAQERSGIQAILRTATEGTLSKDAQGTVDAAETNIQFLQRLIAIQEAQKELETSIAQQQSEFANRGTLETERRLVQSRYGEGTQNRIRELQTQQTEQLAEREQLLISLGEQNTAEGFDPQQLSDLRNQIAQERADIQAILNTATEGTLSKDAQGTVDAAETNIQFLQRLVAIQEAQKELETSIAQQQSEFANRGTLETEKRLVQSRYGEDTQNRIRELQADRSAQLAEREQLLISLGEQNTETKRNQLAELERQIRLTQDLITLNQTALKTEEDALARQFQIRRELKQYDLDVLKTRRDATRRSIERRVEPFYATDADRPDYSNVELPDFIQDYNRSLARQRRIDAQIEADIEREALRQRASGSLTIFGELNQYHPDYERLKGLYDDYMDHRQRAEREDLQRQRRYARQYQRIWENTFSSIADVAIESIFDRSLSFTDALSGIASSTLKDLAGYYLNQFLDGGNASGLIGSGTAAGAGVALGGSLLLFPQQFSALFEEIGKSFNFLGDVPKLFHSSESDLYAAVLGARTQRAIEGDSPTAHQNARDFSDNFSQGFQSAARETQRGDSVPLDTPLTIQVNFGNSENAMIEIGASLRDLIEKGLISLDVP